MHQPPYPHGQLPSKTFGDALEALFIELTAKVKQGQRAPATLEMHRENAGWLRETIPSTTPLADITESVVQCVATMEAQGRRRGPGGQARPNTTGTVAKRLCTLKLSLKIARRHRWIDRLPEFPELERRWRPRREHLRDAGELERLCAALPLERADWVHVAVFTGQHPADVERMRAYVDCDPFARVPWFIRRNTKGRQPEQLCVMPAPLAKRLRARFLREQLAPADELVQPWPKDSRATTLRRLGSKLGLLVRRAMDFRHTCGTWAAHELGSITVGLQQWLGHTSSEMLAKVYAHALPPALAEVARSLARAARAPRRSPQKVLAGGHGAPRKKNAPNGASNTVRGSDPRDVECVRSKAQI